MIDTRSRYNSENTTILATQEFTSEFRGTNTRMLLLHRCDSGRLEYVIGSYFQERLYQGGFGYMRTDYSWDWGHYFNDVVAAVDYWKREVLGVLHEHERFMCHDCSGVYQEHPVELEYSDGTWTCPECGCSTCNPEEDCCIRMEYDAD